MSTICAFVVAVEWETTRRIIATGIKVIYLTGAAVMSLTTIGTPLMAASSVPH